jgi:hypothetical protein
MHWRHPLQRGVRQPYVASQYEMKTCRLALFFASVPVYASMPKGVKPFSEAGKRAAIELRTVDIPLKQIREQLGMSERDPRNILYYTKKQPENPVAR